MKYNLSSDFYSYSSVPYTSSCSSSPSSSSIPIVTNMSHDDEAETSCDERSEDNDMQYDSNKYNNTNDHHLYDTFSLTTQQSYPPLYERIPSNNVQNNDINSSDSTLEELHFTEDEFIEFCNSLDEFL